MATRLMDPRREAMPRTPVADSSGWRERLLDTSSEVHLAACRLVLGGVMFAHGAQKVLGWFAGPGLAGALQGFREHLGIPLPVAALAIAAEFLGSLSLILGFAGRVGAACIAAVMVGAIVLVHARFGFFMNWQGKAPGEGFEYHLLAVALAIPILLRGSGAFSADLALQKRRGSRTSAA